MRAGTGGPPTFPVVRANPPHSLTLNSRPRWGGMCACRWDRLLTGNSIAATTPRPIGGGNEAAPARAPPPPPSGAWRLAEGLIPSNVAEGGKRAHILAP